MNQSQSFFAGIESVDATGMRLPRLPDGQHLLVIDRCLVPRGNGGRGSQNAYVVEFTVEQTHHASMPPGTKCSVYLSSQFRDSWLKQVKAFAAAASGFDIRHPEQDAAFGPASNNVVELSVGAHNVLAGRRVICEGSFSGRYDKKQQPYFNYVFWPYGEAMNLAALPVAQAYQPPAPQYAQPQYPGQPPHAGFSPQPQYGGPPQGQQPQQPQQFALPPQYGGPPQGQPQQGFAPPGQQFQPQGSPFGGWRR